MNLVEKHPSDYDGVLTLAGMIGGSRAEIDYMGDVWNMFEFVYGDDILPGNPCEPAMPPADTGAEDGVVTTEQEYVVQPGDTPIGVANAFGVSLDDLVELETLHEMFYLPGKRDKILVRLPHSLEGLL